MGGSSVECFLRYRDTGTLAAAKPMREPISSATAGVLIVSLLAHDLREARQHAARGHHVPLLDHHDISPTVADE